MASEDTANALAGTRMAIPGARAVDHAGFVIPDLDQGIAFFCDVLGAALLWRSTRAFPSAIDMVKTFGAVAQSRPQIAMLRLGPNLNVELIEYTVPDDHRQMPPSSGLSVGHLAFIVDDIDVAGRYLQDESVQMLAGPRTNARGPNAGQESWFFRTPWGLTLELVERPAHMPYEQEATGRLFAVESR